MKSTQYFILFFVLAGLVVLPATLHWEFFPRTDVQFEQLTITFDGVNATAELEYNVGFLTELYIFFFGNRNLDPYINNFFYGFDEYQIRSFQGNSATVNLNNVSRISPPYYLHDGRPFGSPVNRLVLVFPDGEVRIFENPSKTPNIFYDLPAKDLDFLIFD